MAEKSMFFRSFGDRRYYSSDWAKYFSTLIKGGVFGEQLNSLEVTAAGDGMNSIVKPGRAFIEGYFYENDSDLELTHEAADPVNDRIDRVVLRLDLNDENRYIKAFVRKGEASVNPVPPEPVREENIYEISLAQVKVRAASGIILADDITDERDNEAICGYVRYQAKPAWYPQGVVPLDVWLYVHFPDQLTPQEKADIEANPVLMAIINGDTFHSHKAEDATSAHKPENVGVIIASKEEAEAGTNNKKYMTPLRVRNAMEAVEAGNNLIYYDTESGAGSDTTYFLKRKAVRVYARGSYRVFFTVRASGQHYTSYVRIYVNGSPKSSIISHPGSNYVEYSVDISGIELGDSIEWWGYATTGTGEATRLYIDNVKLGINRGHDSVIKLL